LVNVCSLFHGCEKSIAVKYLFANLSGLFQTTFVNSVDAPSLALLVPIVHRGLRERSAETKKKAAQIVGNMSSLVSEHKDMLPYLSLLLPEVKKVGLFLTVLVRTILLSIFMFYFMQHFLTAISVYVGSG